MTATYQTVGCTGKERIDSKPLADKIRDRMSRRENRPLKVYHCDKCGGWHVGGSLSKGGK